MEYPAVLAIGDEVSKNSALAKFFKDVGFRCYKEMVRSHVQRPDPEVSKKVEAQTEQTQAEQAQLWAHCTSQHAVIMNPSTSLKDLRDYHEHEHNGPCTIRNHDREDRSYSLKKIGKVLSESET